MTTFEGRILFWTQRSIFFQCHYWEGAVFFPISQLEIEPDGDEGYVIRVRDWLTNKRGILEFTHYNEADIERIAST